MPGVAQDVAEIARLLSSGDGAKHGSTVVLQDEFATRERVLDELDNVLDAAADDDVFIHMAGHGAVVGGAYYFVPHLGGDGVTADRAVPMSAVRQRFEACAARRVILFLDCCYSGGILARGGDTPAPAIADARAALERAIQFEGGTGKMIYAACTETQSAYEDPVLRHGYFTHAIVTGLRGEAANLKGKVTVNSLFDHVAEEVELAMGSERQLPMQSGQMSGQMVLRHVADRAASTPAVSSPSPGAASTVTSSGGATVDSSGALVMLGDMFFDRAEVKSDGEELVVLVASAAAETDAALGVLHAPHHPANQTIAYAHLNGGGDVHVVSANSVSRDGQLLWTLRLRKEQKAQGFIMDVSEGGLQTDGRTYTPHDFAVIKASRILLDRDLLGERNGPGLGRASLSIEGFLSDGRGLLGECPLRDLRSGLSVDTDYYLRCARLRCVYLLKQLNVVDTVLELQLGPAEASKVAVRFRGRRPNRYGDEPGEKVEVDGVYEFGAP